MHCLFFHLYSYHLDCLTPRLSEVPEGDWYCPHCIPIINGQYFEPLESSDSGTEARLDWDSSSESDSDVNEIKRRRYVQNQSSTKAPRVLISESESEISESDSDVDEMKRRRSIQNVCAIGEPRVLISSSEVDSESSFDSSNEGSIAIGDDRGNSKGNENGWSAPLNTSVASQEKKAVTSPEQTYISSSSIPNVSGTSNPPRSPYIVQLENVSDSESIASGYCSTDFEPNSVNHGCSSSYVTSPTQADVRTSKMAVPADSSTDKDSAQSFLGLLRNISVPISPHLANSRQPPHATGGVKTNPVQNKDRKVERKFDGTHKKQADSTSQKSNSFQTPSPSTMSHSKEQHNWKHQNQAVETVSIKASKSNSTVSPAGLTTTRYCLHQSPRRIHSSNRQSATFSPRHSPRTRPLQHSATVSPRHSSRTTSLQYSSPRHSARTRPRQRSSTVSSRQSATIRHSSSANVQPKVQRRRRKRRRRKRRAKIVLGQRAQSFRPREHRPDGPYRPSVSVSMNERDAVFTRGKARTVASFTPQRRAIREAVRESYRHSNTGTGLEVARKIILAQHKPGYDPNYPFQGASFSYRSPRPTGVRHQADTPLSGYCTPNSDYSVSTHRLHADPSSGRANLTHSPLSAYSSLATNTDREHRVASEISRRTVPNRKLLTVFHNSSGMSPSRDQQHTSNGGSSDGGLLDEICQNLDDLNNTQNVVKRDGSIIPMSESNCLY